LQAQDFGSGVHVVTQRRYNYSLYSELGQKIRTIAIAMVKDKFP